MKDGKKGIRAVVQRRTYPEETDRRLTPPTPLGPRRKAEALDCADLSALFLLEEVTKAATSRRPPNLARRLSELQTRSRLVGIPMGRET